MQQRVWNEVKARIAKMEKSRAYRGERELSEEYKDVFAVKEEYIQKIAQLIQKCDDISFLDLILQLLNKSI